MSELNENDFPLSEPQPFVTEEGREIERLSAELAAAQALNKAWEQKAATWLATPEAAARLENYRDLGQQAAQAQNESERLRAELASAQKQRDEAHGLIAKWKEWLVDTFEHDVIGTYARAKSNCMCDVSESDKRALLAATATAKEGGGA